jgi:predicted TIM-barrel fold metal-dependent hydrolase
MATTLDGSKSDAKVKIWANSGDSHILEPDNLWHDILPKELADRMPRTERVSEDEEIVYVDGESFSRPVPRAANKKLSANVRGEKLEATLNDLSHRPPGARDVKARIADLNGEGIWGEVIYPSTGIWDYLVTDPKLIKVAFREVNEWRLSEVQNFAPDRWVVGPTVPLMTVEDAVDEVRHVADIGFHCVFLPCEPPAGSDDWNSDVWEPFWSLLEEIGLVITVHLGSERGGTKLLSRGPGKAVYNYVETTYGPQRFATKLVASGVLDRHPNLKVLLSEAGASWVPFLGDRMNEGYRQHEFMVTPKLKTMPKEILYRQVYATFQHDVSAVDAAISGYTNVMWGSDYPHMEGTFGHTQETLHELFDQVDPSLRQRITIDTFRELFPHVSAPPASD